MDILQLAKKLNEEILKSREYTELKEIENYILKDERTIGLLKEYSKYKNMLLKIEDLNYEDKARIKAGLRLKLTKVYEEIENDPKLSSLSNKIDNYLRLRESISKIVDNDIEFNNSLFSLRNDDDKKCQKNCAGCYKTRD